MDNYKFDPHTIAFGSSGNLYVRDTNNRRIQKFDSNGNFITKRGSKGSGDGQFSEHAHGIATIFLIISIQQIDSIIEFKFDSNANFITKWRSEGSEDGQFKEPHSSATDSRSNIHVSDMNNYRIQKFDSKGNFITKWGSEGSEDGRITTLEDIEIDSFDKVFATDRGRKNSPKKNNYQSMII